MAEADANPFVTDDEQGALAGATEAKVEDEKKEHSGETASPMHTSFRAVLWEIIKPVATIGFAISVIGAITLYAYLHRIGWPELLQPSLASKTGIAIVVISLLVVFVSLTLTMYGSAYWTNLVAHSYEQPSLIPRRLGIFAVGVHIVWLILLDVSMLGFAGDKSYLWARGVKNHFNAWLAVFFALVASASICFHWWARRNLFEGKLKAGFCRKLYNRLRSLLPAKNAGTGEWTWRVISEDLSGRLKRIGQDASRGSLLALGSLFASTSACVFVEINPTIRSLDITFLNSLIVCSATLPGLFIGIRYIKQYRFNGNVRGSLKDVASFAIVMGVAACVMFPATTLLPLDTLSLGAASVFTDTEHQYVLEKKDSWALYEKIGFRLIDKALDEKSPIIFAAYERYRMGDILLLCTNSNSPAQVDKKSESTNTPGAKAVTEKPPAAPAKSANDKSSLKDGCLQAEKGEVRRVEIAR